MKMNLKTMLCAMFAGLLAMFASGAEVIKLGTAEAAAVGATHQIIVYESDLTDTNTATFTQTLTNGVIPANSVVVPVALFVSTPFNINSATTNAYNFTTVSVGDSASATQFVPSTQINGNGTNASFNISAQAVGTVSLTMQTFNAGVTNNSNVLLPVVTNVTAATSSGAKSYTSANAFRFAFTGQTNQALSAFTKGRLDFYYRLVQLP